MDPAGPWYASYNRLPPGSTNGTFPTGGPDTGDFVTHDAVPSTTTSPLLLQTAHTNASLVAQPSAFNPGGFIPPPSTSYEAFSPLFHHQNAKQGSSYVAGHRQAILSQSQTAAKPVTREEISEPDGGNLRENYQSTHQQGNAGFFDSPTQATSPNASSLAWSHQTNAQVPSPFGILPHESVVPSSPGPSNIKPGTTGYEGNFNAPFTPGPSINDINNSQLSMTVPSNEFKTSNYTDRKKGSRSGSPPEVRSTVCTSPVDTGHTFFQQGTTNFGSENIGNNYQQGISHNQTPNIKVPVPLQHQQQSCIVSTQSTNSTKDYRLQQGSRSNQSTIAYSSIVQGHDKNGRNFITSSGKSGSNGPQPVQTKAQAKIYPDIVNHEIHRSDSILESTQSSPISFSIMDSRNLNYSSNSNSNGNGIIQSNQRPPMNPNIQPQHQQFHVINQQQTQSSSQQAPYRNYATNSQSDSDYHHPRSKSAASTDSAYSSTTSTQNGGDCGVVVPRRPSPLQAHSQASPLGHVPSPAYPMYNSPMTSMSSPSPLQLDNSINQCPNAQTYKAQQQVTPPLPLDVTVTRSASQNHVAYPSVITRALGASDANKTIYERSDQSAFSQKQQICWENENAQNRKFSQPYGGNNELISQAIPGQQQTQRVLGIPERQTAYFDSNQVPLKDLSSCQGDQMNITKNLQNTNCQVQQQQQQQQQQQIGVLSVSDNGHKHGENKSRKSDSNKKRKSYDKGLPHISPTSSSSSASCSVNEVPAATTMPEMDYGNRIPPPAHHKTIQQAQNGYYDYDRWSLAPNAGKMLPGTTGAFGNQPNIHHTGNFIGNAANQHQGMMVPPQLTQPSIPYFPAFHVPSGHHPHEFQSSVDIPPIGIGENPPNQQNLNYQDYRDDQPKVIVPNIEEELGFLQHNEIMAQQANQQMNREIKLSSKDPNSGFMTSYLKFLQGDREPSPPPANRGGRKATWNRSRPYVPPESNRPCEMSTNGQMENSKLSNSTIETPTIDYANDPRYFPLPKERKKPYIDSSDDGIDSEDDFPFSIKKNEKKLNNNSTNVDTNAATKPEQRPKPKKGRPIKPGGPTDRKRKAAAAAAALAAAAEATPGSKPSKKPAALPLPPRRETSKRKAKEKISNKQLSEQQSDDEEQGDSDTDPAWTPAAKLAGDEDEKKKKRGRLVISKRGRKLLVEDDYSTGDVTVSKRGKRKNDGRNSTNKLSCKIDEKLLASISDEDIDISPFKSGEFVVFKSELSEEFPALWRIDGKTLLQKYEPFVSDGKTLYRNISTYSGWAPQKDHIYQQVPVKFWRQDKLQTIVEFLRDEMILDDSEYMELSIKENEKYQDHFEVYIQTLISQALDSNFLTEIFQEQDDYFLSNVKTVDEITEERKRRLLSTTTWPQNLILAFSTWPCLNILKDVSSSETKSKPCSGCKHTKIFARILPYGQPYNATTLEGSPPNPRLSEEKDFLLCRVCQAKVGLFNKVAHQKYLMFLECARRVAEKRIADPNKDTTIILNELLADEVWLNQLFKDVRLIWAEIDSIEHQTRKKENSMALDKIGPLNPSVPNVQSRTDSDFSIEGTTNESLSSELTRNVSFL